MAKGAVGQLPLFGLVMIGKNEAGKIERALESVKPLIGAWTYCDNGSEDDTIKIVQEKVGHLPGKVYRHKWQRFGHNLTLAHERAKGTARWLLWMHADMEVVLTSPNFKGWFARRRNLGIDAFNVNTIDVNIDNPLPLIMDGRLSWRYVGPTHEYLDLTDRKRIMKPLTGIYIIHHADGGNRSVKNERDLKLLTPGFQAGDPRDTFYMAQTLRYRGKDAAAIGAYSMRTRLGGWDEEVWYSKYQIASLKGDVEGLIAVWREKPWRHEPLMQAARIVGARPSLGGLFCEHPPA